MAEAAAAPIGEVPSVLDRECWLNGKDNGCRLVGNAIGVLAVEYIYIFYYDINGSSSRLH